MRRIAAWWSGLRFPYNVLASLALGLLVGGFAWLCLLPVPDRYFDLAWSMCLVGLLGAVLWGAVAHELMSRRIRRRRAQPQDPS
jgi:membrane associated rhomboid family serine protease